MIPMPPPRPVPQPQVPLAALYLAEAATARTPAAATQLAARALGSWEVWSAEDGVVVHRLTRAEPGEVADALAAWLVNHGEVAA